MIEAAILGLLGIMGAGGVAFGIRVEHRMTKVECIVDAIAKKNGIVPEACVLQNRIDRRRK